MRSFLLLVCATTASAWGFCNDKNMSCASWADDGHCLSNEAFMSTTCPYSCGVCTHRCRDINASCADWAATGQCTQNPRYMNANCPTSCGLCMARFDRSDSREWSRLERCESAVRTCAYIVRRCGICTDTAWMPPTARWALRGECHRTLARAADLSSRMRRLQRLCLQRHQPDAVRCGAQCRLNPGLLCALPSDLRRVHDGLLRYILLLRRVGRGGRVR